MEEGYEFHYPNGHRITPIFIKLWFFFDIYHKNSFKQEPRTTWIDGWKIEYMAIADPRTIHNTPIVIVGGAFQNFNSYKYCVEQFFESGPVILIDLPSMGANQQITNIDSGLSAGTLELPDLSRMLGQWLDIVAIEKVAVVGIFFRFRDCFIFLLINALNWSKK